MKKKFKNIPKLHKNYLLKFFIFLALVIVLEVVTGAVIYFNVSNKTYKQEYSAFGVKASSLGNVVQGTYGDTLTDDNLEDSALRDKVMATCSSNGGFDYYVIFTETASGNIVVGCNDLGLAENSSLTAQGVAMEGVSTYEHGGKTYVAATFEISENYHIACFMDFSASQANINNILGNTVAALVVFGVLVAVMFLGYAYALLNRERTTLFRYKFKLNKVGKIVKSNAAFKKDYSNAYEIKSPEKLDRKNFSLVTLPMSTGDSGMLAVRAHGVKNSIKVYGGAVANAEAFTQVEGEEGFDSAGLSTGSLSKLFEGFIAKGKRTLLGVMLISDLDQIKTLFGKQMATDIQRIILKKCKEKFTYAFELDFGYIGVIHPDGKKLDIIVSDMEDVFRYINAPLRIDDNLFTLEIKAGFAMCDSTMQPLNFEHAFQAAEAAKQRAIDTKIADYIVYHESQIKLYAKYFIKYDIKQMLSEGAFEMEYQPQYNIKQASIEGFEALFRVKKSWNVNVDTFSFITYAERTGAMVQLGDFIFDTGMQFAKSIEGKNVSVSLNVSPVQLMQAGFIENFLRLYRKYDLKEGAICVEITESFLMTNFTETLKKLGMLTKQGIKVHLDDFGTEYSSLLYLKKLPISTIKIDKEFVKDVLVSRESQAIIKFITNIAKLLNCTTICEGVETCREFDMLNYLGCDTIQGWIISKSLKPEAAAELIDTFDYKKVVAAQQAKENL